MRKHLVATGDNPADQLPQQRRAGTVCVGVGWVGASWRATRDPDPRASSGLCQQFKRSERRHNNYVKQ
jgi:hypothetical protein